MRETDHDPGDDRQPIEQQNEALASLVAKLKAKRAKRCEVAECNPLPANCPFTKRLPKGRDHIVQAIEDGVIPCCRIERLSWLDSREPPLCRIEGDEVYRFLYRQAFGRHASIMIAKRRDEITVERRYYPGIFNKPERFAALLTEADWEWLHAVLAAANFWSLPRLVHSQGCYLDGFHLIIEARVGERFRASRFNNPDVEEFWQLGRTAFDLAGLGHVRL